MTGNNGKALREAKARLLETLKWWIAGKEMSALMRYRKACHLVWRWNGSIPQSCATAEWIRDVGEDSRGADIEQFRERVRVLAVGEQP